MHRVTVLRRTSQVFQPSFARGFDLAAPAAERRVAADISGRYDRVMAAWSFVLVEHQYRSPSVCRQAITLGWENAMITCVPVLHRQEFGKDEGRSARVVHKINFRVLQLGWLYGLALEDSVKVESILPLPPLSCEERHVGWLKRSTAIYRLAFGQPRQDDLLAVLAHRGNVAPMLIGLVPNLEYDGDQEPIGSA